MIVTQQHDRKWQSIFKHGHQIPVNVKSSNNTMTKHNPFKIKLAFFHKVCDKHKPLIKKVSSKDHSKKAQEVMDALEFALSVNRDQESKKL